MKYGCHVIWAVRSPDKAASVLNQLEKKEKLTGKAFGTNLCRIFSLFSTLAQPHAFPWFPPILGLIRIHPFRAGDDSED